MNLYVTVTQTSEGGEICEGEEDSKWPSYEPKQLHTCFHAAYRSEPSARHEEIEVSNAVGNCSSVWLAVVYYTTGNTFSSTEGNPFILGLFPTAALAEEAILKATTSTEYMPWDGYFSSFERSEVLGLAVHS